MRINDGKNPEVRLSYSVATQGVRRIGSTFLAVSALLLLSAIGASAQVISVLINGSPVQFDNMRPQEIDGRVLVPVRGVLEKLGANVAWVPQSHTVIASNATVDIQLQIGNQHATVNGKDVFLDVPAQIMAGSTMVPLRFLGEALGARVGWDGPNHTVLITVQDGQNNPGDGDHRDHSHDHDHDHDHDRPVPPRGPAPTIDQLRTDASNWLRAGQTIHIVLDGTPGGQAIVRIPGIAENIQLNEAAPGHYVGEWAVPVDRPCQVTNAAVIGYIKIGDQSSQLLQAGQLLAIDNQPPTIRDRGPEAETHVCVPRPTIFAVFDDSGSGIDPRRIRLRVDGNDVTPLTTITRDFVSFTPTSPLPPGPQVVELFGADRAGNETRSRWIFVEDANAANLFRPLQLNIDHPLGPDEPLVIESFGIPGCTVVFNIGNIRNVPMREDRPGHYIGNYRVRQGDNVPGQPVNVHYVTRDGVNYVQQSSRAITIAAGRPMPPVITNPGPNDAPRNPLVIAGHGTPNTRVHVKVTYSSKMLGIVGLQGTAADMVVDVDKNGNWQSTPINLSTLFGNRNVDYNVQASAVGPNQSQGEVTQRTFRMR